MLYLFTFLTLLLSFLRSNVVYAHNDELMEAMVKAAREQGLVAGLPAPPKNKPGPKPGPPSANLRALQGKDKPKPDPKPKPTPPQYMVFTNHIDDNTCGDRSGIESHGYLIGTCYTGKGDLAGLHWSFTPTVDTTNIHLNYAFYADADCTVSVFSSVESVPNGCQARGTAGGHLRAKNFQILPAIPNYKGGSLFNGYVSEAVCKRDNRLDVLLWSFLKNNACDPQISSPVYGEHVTDETRTCKKDKIVATLYDSNDLTCSGAVTTTTNIGPSWECVDATISGVDATFVNPKCV